MLGSKYYWINDYLDQNPKDLTQTAFNLNYYKYQDSNISSSTRLAILELLLQKKKILIYGDYDVDGITSVVILRKCFTVMKINNIYHIPDRIKEGYGLALKNIKFILEKKVDCVILVDNGITASEEIELLRSKNIDVIIIDHHKISSSVPDANFIIHPELTEGFFDKKFCAAALTYFFCKEVFFDHFNKKTIKYLDNEFLQLVFLALTADMMPLNNELNFYLAKNGFVQLKKNPIAFIKLFFDKNKINYISSDNINFLLIPCLNAVGRLDDSKKVVEAFLLTEQSQIKMYIEEFITINNYRKELTYFIYEECKKILKASSIDRGFTILSDAKWNIGILGIVAGKLVREYNTAFILVTINSSGDWSGSARSCGNYDLQDLFTYISPYVLKTGGHKYAGGITFKKNDMCKIKNSLKVYNTRFNNFSTRKNKIIIDKWVNNIDEIHNLIKIQNNRQPFGNKNRKFILALKQVVINSIVKFGKEKNHLKIFVKYSSQTYEIMSFYHNYSQKLKEGQLADILVECEYSSINRRKLQYMLIDIRLHKQQFYETADMYKKHKIKNYYILDKIPLSYKSFLREIKRSNCSNIILDIQENEVHEIKLKMIIEVFKYLNKFKSIDINSYKNTELSYLDKSIFLYIIKILYELNFVIIKKAVCMVDEKSLNRRFRESIYYNNSPLWINFRNALISKNKDFLLKYVSLNL